MAALSLLTIVFIFIYVSCSHGKYLMLYTMFILIYLMLHCSSVHHYLQYTYYLLYSIVYSMLYQCFQSIYSKTVPVV